MTHNVQIKKCCNCKKYKQLFEFGVCRRLSFGVRNICKKCRHKECILHKEEKSIYNRKHYIKNADKYKQKAKEQRKTYKEEIKQYKKEYAKNNVEKIRKYMREYNAQRRKNDLSYRIIGVLRARLRSAISNKSRKGSAIRDLGCSIDELMTYLEKMFYKNPDTGEKMSWDNHGLLGWHIDHIIPLSSFDLTKPRQIKKAVHYTNLQPLWAKDNIIKSDKVEDINAKQKKRTHSRKA